MTDICCSCSSVSRCESDCIFNQLTTQSVLHADTQHGCCRGMPNFDCAMNIWHFTIAAMLSTSISVPWILLTSILASAENLASVENQQLLLHLQDLSLQHITNILWTYASFLHDVPDMLPAFTSQILERSHKEQFNAQQLSNLLWSLCILQVCPLWPWLICKLP